MRHVANSLVGPFVALLLPLTALAQQDAKRLLLIGQGPDGHKPGTHEFMADVQMLAKLLEPIDALQTTVVNGDEPFADGPKLIGSVWAKGSQLTGHPG